MTSEDPVWRHVQCVWNDIIFRAQNSRLFIQYACLFFFVKRGNLQTSWWTGECRIHRGYSKTPRDTYRIKPLYLWLVPPSPLLTKSSVKYYFAVGSLTLQALLTRCCCCCFSSNLFLRRYCYWPLFALLNEIQSFSVGRRIGHYRIPVRRWPEHYAEIIVTLCGGIPCLLSLFGPLCIGVMQQGSVS